MPYRTLRCRREGPVLVVEFHDPPRNLMTTTMIGELSDLVGELKVSRAVGSVVFTGALPGVFIAHFDVQEIAAGAEKFRLGITPAQARAALGGLRFLRRIPGAERLLRRTPLAGALTLLELNDLFRRMNRLDKVLVAAINGIAYGGGLELALACDVRLMAAGDHTIGLPETLLGLVPGAGGCQRLARLLGPGRALELMLEGRALTATEAQSLGVVHRVVPADKLLAEAEATAARLARRSPESVAVLKRAVYEDASLSLGAGLRRDAAGFMHLATTEAAARLVRALLDEAPSRAEVPPEQVVETFERFRDGQTLGPSLLDAGGRGRRD